MRQCPIVKDPEVFGVDTQVPELAQVEGAYLLANEARPHLAGCNFTERQILAWAETYIATEGSGDVESFLDWIDECQEAAVTT
jgi:hypothetical protein